MKCPTCGYIGFETTDRCRNCGYEFALATTAPAAPDLAIKSGGDSGGPLRELDMRPAEPRPAPVVATMFQGSANVVGAVMGVLYVVVDCTVCVVATVLLRLSGTVRPCDGTLGVT